MYVKEDFYYIYEKESYIKNKLGIEKKNMLAVIDAIQDVCDWLEQSCFKSLSENLYIEITDTPIIDSMAFIGANDENKEIMIFINITHIVYSFEKEDIKKIFLVNDMFCYEFAAFVFLHEIGHLVHACLQNPGENFIEEKVINHLKNNEKIYNRYRKWIENSKYYNPEKVEILREHNMVHKKYRKLPNEKQADNFAKRYIKRILQLKEGRK